MGINMSRQSNSHHDTGMAKPQPSLLAGTGPRGLVVKEPRLSCSIGEDGAALAEVVHDSMHDLTGNMLRHPKLNEKAEKIHKTVVDTVAEGKHRTVDLGGTSTTTEFTNSICDHLLNQ
ncbi:BnaC06g18690D [Brassica napus]|uniref:BnaC06g18690D protein n=1 Tax=Brassica napus TaxID=3708 RepID=A0A078IEY3_BRANA|nr:BnaC06g18690D [Brassica napus]